MPQLPQSGLASLPQMPRKRCSCGVIGRVTVQTFGGLCILQKRAEVETAPIKPIRKRDPKDERPTDSLFRNAMGCAGRNRKE